MARKKGPEQRRHPRINAILYDYDVQAVTGFHRPLPVAWFERHNIGSELGTEQAGDFPLGG